MKNKFNSPSISTTSILLLSYLGTGLLLFVIILLLRTYRIPFEYISRNPESHFGIPIYAGLFQKIRVILWSASISICFFTYLIIKTSSYGNQNAKYIYYSGILTLLLFIDDYFQIHSAARLILHIQNTFVYLAYALYVLYIFYRFKEIILNSEYKILIVAFLLLGLAAVMDLLNDAKIITFGIEEELEASIKIFGVVTWTIYYVGYCFENLKATILKNRFLMNRETE